MAGRYDIQMDRGATFVKDLLWKVAGKPLDLTGYSGYLVVTPDYGSDDVLFDLTTDNGEITTDAEGGIHLTCPAHETVGVKEGLYVYDLFVRSEWQVFKLLTGTWRVNPSIISEE